MNTVIGIAIGVGAVVTAEILFNYSLGDFVKDRVIHIFHGAETVAYAQQTRLEARLSRVKAKIAGLFK